MAFIGTIVADITLRNTKFNKAISSASTRLDNLSKTATRVGRAMTTKVTLPIVGLGTAVLVTAAKFETAMINVQALTGATGDEFAKLESQAKQLGRTTQFSATQVGDAMGFLAKSGKDVNEIYGATPKVLELAAAAALDMASAADIVTNIMSGFSLQTEELSEANDVLVNAFTNANVDLLQLGQSFKFAGPIAKGAGLTFKETAAFLALMGNAGIQASMAGTTLRASISAMLDPSKEAAGVLSDLGVQTVTSSGELRNMTSILGELKEAGASTSDILKIFGLRAGPGMQALISQGEDTITNFITLLGRTGTASKIAAARMEGLGGAWKRFKSALEGVALAIADTGLLGNATKLTETFATLTTNMAEASPETLRMVVMVAALAAVIGPLALTAGLVGSGIALIGSNASAAAISLGGFVKVIGTAAAPVLVILAGFLAWKSAIKDVQENWDTLKQAMTEDLGPLGRIVSDLDRLFSAIRQRNVDRKKFLESLVAGDDAKNVGKAAGEALTTVVETVKRGIGSAFKGLLSETKGLLGNLTEEFKGTFGGVIDGTLDLLPGKIKGILGEVQALLDSNPLEAKMEIDDSAVKTALNNLFPAILEPLEKLKAGISSAVKVDASAVGLDPAIQKIKDATLQMQLATSIANGLANAMQFQDVKPFGPENLPFTSIEDIQSATKQLALDESVKEGKKNLQKLGATGQRVANTMGSAFATMSTNVLFGVESLTDGIKGFFKSMVGFIIQELAKIAATKLISSFLGSALFAGAGLATGGVGAAIAGGVATGVSGAATSRLLERQAPQASSDRSLSRTSSEPKRAQPINLNVRGRAIAEMVIDELMDGANSRGHTLQVVRTI